MFRLRFEKNVVATAFSLTDKAVEDALLAIKKCFNEAYILSFNPSHYHVVKVKTCKETIYLVYFGCWSTEKPKHLDSKKTTLQQLLAFASLVVYNGKCHAADDQTAKILKNAIIKRISPSISAVLTKANCKRQKNPYLEGMFLGEGSVPNPI
jgi:hypothetical protein